MFSRTTFCSIRGWGGHMGGMQGFVVILMMGWCTIRFACVCFFFTMEDRRWGHGSPGSEGWLAVMFNGNGRERYE